MRPAINNLGQIVGARSTLGYTPTGSGWLYRDGQGLVSLSAQYGLWVVPWDINDAGLIIAGAEQLNLASGQVTPLPAGPSNYYTPTGRYLNNSGQIGGYAPTTSTSLNIVSVFRYDPGKGWLFIAGTSKYTMVSSLNGGGDVGYGELGAGLYLEGQGTYAVYSLLDPAVTAAGWTITGSSPKINDGRQVAVSGSNSSTGQAGGVLLDAGRCGPAAHGPGQPAGPAARRYHGGAMELDRPDVAEHQQPDQLVRDGAPDSRHDDLDTAHAGCSAVALQNVPLRHHGGRGRHL